MSLCKYCGAEIDWLRDPSGRCIPVDIDPVFVVEGDGADLFYIEDGAPPITGRVARSEEESPERMVAFVPHRRTCKR